MYILSKCHTSLVGNHCFGYNNGSVKVLAKQWNNNVNEWLNFAASVGASNFSCMQHPKYLQKKCHG